eukprot:1219-Heterococcus_DN1.PRE.1
MSASGITSTRSKQDIPQDYVKEARQRAEARMAQRHRTLAARLKAQWQEEQQMIIYYSSCR